MVYITLAIYAFLFCIQIIVVFAIYYRLLEFQNTQNQWNRVIAESLLDLMKKGDIANDEMELLLWKTRYDMVVWKDSCIENEEYEAVEGIQAAIDKAEELIVKYRKLRENEKINN